MNKVIERGSKVTENVSEHVTTPVANEVIQIGTKEKVPDDDKHLNEHTTANLEERVKELEEDRQEQNVQVAGEISALPGEVDVTSETLAEIEKQAHDLDVKFEAEKPVEEELVKDDKSNNGKNPEDGKKPVKDEEKDLVKNDNGEDKGHDVVVEGETKRTTAISVGLGITAVVSGLGLLVAGKKRKKED